MAGEPEMPGPRPPIVRMEPLSKKKCQQFLTHLRVWEHCGQHTDPLDCPDAIIYHDKRTNRYGIPVRDQPDGKANSYVEITHCPWCGEEL